MDEIGSNKVRCGYCCGHAVEVDGHWRHTTTTQVPGSTRHHHKGSVVLTVDLEEWEDEAA